MRTDTLLRVLTTSDHSPKTVTKVLLCAPRGFCAGVEMAIKALAQMVRVFDPPVYCYHEIVHNKLVVELFQSKGVVFVDTIDEIPPGRPIMLSAHGSAPEVVQAANDTGSYVINAVCPLVTKVHHEVKSRARQGYNIIYVGHAGHEEAVGTMAVAPDSIHRVESIEELNHLNLPGGPTALLAQTTLSHRDWSDVAEEAADIYPELFTPEKSDLCFATTNRQAALERIAKECDSFIVIGSANSSNTIALAKLAAESGCPNVTRVNDASELPTDVSGVVGVTAGASAPEHVVQEIINRLSPIEGTEQIEVTQEDEYFPPPRGLRKLHGAIEALCAAAFGPTDMAARPSDKEVSASEIMGGLGSLS